MTLDSLSQGDATKWEYFTKMKVIEFLNTISYYKDKAQWLKDSMK